MQRVLEVRCLHPLRVVTIVMELYHQIQQVLLSELGRPIPGRPHRQVTTPNSRHLVRREHQAVVSPQCLLLPTAGEQQPQVELQTTRSPI